MYYMSLSRHWCKLQLDWFTETYVFYTSTLHLNFKCLLSLIVNICLSVWCFSQVLLTVSSWTCCFQGAYCWRKSSSMLSWNMNTSTISRSYRLPSREWMWTRWEHSCLKFLKCVIWHKIKQKETALSFHKWSFTMRLAYHSIYCIGVELK